MNKRLSLAERLHGTRIGQVHQEFLSNSAYFPLANFFLEFLREGLDEFVFSPDPYVLLSAGLLQAWFLGSWQFAGRPRPFLGNLIGPAVYTAVEGMLEGSKFFAAPHHIAYWVFAVSIGLCQWLRLNVLAPQMRTVVILAENLLRAGILMVMYWLFEAYINPREFSLVHFFSDPSHIYIALVLLALALVIGFSEVTNENHRTILHETALQLRKYSEWAMGSELVSRAVGDAETLSLRRQERTLVFADLRGFTSWSETQEPEQVVQMLNSFYRAVEEAVDGFAPIKIKFSADEALLVFAQPRNGLGAALTLVQNTQLLLAGYQLKMGIGIHTGPVVEGLLGSESVKAYDVIGDSVNIAKRLCDNAAGDEVLVSEITAIACGGLEKVQTRELSVKGKSRPITVRLLHSDNR